MPHPMLTRWQVGSCHRLEKPCGDLQYPQSVSFSGFIAYTYVKIEFDGFFEHNHPEIVKDNLPEIEEFSRVSRSRTTTRFGEMNPLAVLAHGGARSPSCLVGNRFGAPRGLLYSHSQVRAKERGPFEVYEIHQIYTGGEPQDRKTLGVRPHRYVGWAPSPF